MTRKSGVFLIIDPAGCAPEVHGLNDILKIHQYFSNSNDYAVDNIELVFPNLCRQRLCDHVAGRHIAGLICLGSVANITEKLDWVQTLAKDLMILMQNRRVPVLGVCFTHQLLADAFGGKVDFLKRRLEVPYSKHKTARESEIVSLKMRLLFAHISIHDHFSQSAIDNEYGIILRETLTWNSSQWNRLVCFATDADWHLTSEERRVAHFINTHCPQRYWMQVAHEQEVHDSGALVVASRSQTCTIDGLVHPQLPVFSVQGHPERRHVTGDGLRFIANFIRLSSVSVQHRTL